MIFFGTKEKIVKKGKLTVISCPNCDENSSFTYIISIKYFHLYWIPFFPYKTKTEIDCNECQETLSKNQISEQIKGKLQRENDLKPIRKPVWMFSGLIILGILIPLAFYQSSNATSTKEVYATNPQVGDVYFLNCTPSNYTTMKVASIENDSIFFIANDTLVRKFKKIFTINEDKYYSNKIKVYSKSQIKAFFKNDSIYKIER